MLLYYLRHGDPIYDPDSLTPLGERQAEALGRRLSQVDLSEIYVSSSNRAQLTAKPTCEMTHLKPTVLDWTNEKHTWAQLTAPVEENRVTWLFQHPSYRPVMASEEVYRLGRRWHEHPAFAGLPCGEGISRVQRETDAWLETFGYHHDLSKNMYYSQGGNKKRIALFAHQGFGLAFLSCLLDIPYPQFAVRFDIQHTGMCVVHFPEQEGWVLPRLMQLSNDSHIYGEHLPTTYNHELRL